MSTSNQQFGLIVAYLLPGFIGLCGIALIVPAVAQWLRPVAGSDGLGIGPPVYAVLAAMAVGMITSCFRWLIVDHLLEWTGVPQAARGYDGLAGKLSAVDYLIDADYRYYQFYANTLVAIIWAYLLNRFMGTLPFLGFSTDGAILVLCVVLVAGSRDALLKYRRRVGRVLS